jgi:hypothetical protein
MHTLKQAFSLLATAGLLVLISGTGGTLAQTGGSVSGQAALGTPSPTRACSKKTAATPSPPPPRGEQITTAYTTPVPRRR